MALVRRVDTAAAMRSMARDIVDGTGATQFPDVVGVYDSNPELIILHKPGIYTGPCVD
jgi:hypothetical protein